MPSYYIQFSSKRPEFDQGKMFRARLENKKEILHAKTFLSQVVFIDLTTVFNRSTRLFIPFSKNLRNFCWKKFVR